MHKSGFGMHNLIRKAKAFFKRKVIISWIVSYLVVLVLPMMGSVYIYLRAESSMKTELHEMDSQMLETLQVTTEELMASMQAMTMNLYTNADAKVLLGFREGQSGYEPYATRLAKTMQMFHVYNQYISDVYIYFCQSDLVVCKSHYNTSRAFFAYYFEDTDASYGQWMEWMKGNAFMSYRAYRSKNGEPDVVDVKFHFPLSDATGQSGEIVMRMQGQDFDDLIEQYQGYGDKSFYILGSDQQLLMSYGAPRTAESLQPGQLQSDREIIIRNFSEVTGWQYVSVTPVSYINNKLFYNRLMLIVNLLLCILAGAVSIVYFIRRNYRPIHTIVSMGGAAHLKGVRDEYEIINMIVKDYIDTKSKYRTISYENETSRKTELLSNILKGRIAEYPNIDKEMAKYNIKFISEYFAVVVFKITDMAQPIRQEPGADSQAEDMILFVMTNVMEELLDRDNKGYVFESDGRIYAIISLDGEMEDWQTPITRAICEGQTFIKSNFNFSFTASMSGAHHTIGGIADAYKEAVRLQRYRTELKQDSIVFYDQVEGIFPNSTFEKERYALQFLQIGNYESAKKVVDAIVKEIFQSGDVAYIRLRMNNLVSLISGVGLAQEQDASEVDYTALSNCADAAVSFDSPAECLQRLDELLQTVCAIAVTGNKKTLDQTEDTKEWTVERLKTYVLENYDNNDLNIALIGDYFDITPYYVSSLFKKSEGISLLDYIGMVRVEKAKERIAQSPQTSFEEISYQVGFNNIKSFIRAFSKYEGCTPGQYRNRLK